MKIIFKFIVFSLVFTGCVTTTTTTNSMGYKIKTVLKDDYDDYWDRVVYCNDEPAVAINEWDESYVLRGVTKISGWYYYEDIRGEKHTIDTFINSSDGWEVLVSGVTIFSGRYYARDINGKGYIIDIDKILPKSVADQELDKMVKEKTGFNSLEELNRHRENERKAAMEERKRLRDDVDKKFGVVAIGSLLHVKNGEVKIGEIIRLGDVPGRYSWSRSSRGDYLFGDFNEFEIRGFDMRQEDDKGIRFVNRPLALAIETERRERRGYIVKYLGTEDVITQAGLRKVIWVLEYIGGNIYVD